MKTLDSKYRTTVAAGILLLLPLAAGCEDLQPTTAAVEKQPQQGGVSKPITQTPVQPQIGSAAAGASHGSETPAPRTAPAKALADRPIEFRASRPADSSVTRPERLPVRLSIGVALPQTGPNGTLMSFTIDYRFEGHRSGRRDNTSAS